MKFVRNLQIAMVIILSGLFVGSQAKATDLLSVKDDVASPVFSWTGAYIGLHASFGVGDTEGHINDLPPGLDLSSDYEMNGALYGGQIGYNWQNGNFVFGVNASISGSEIDGAQNTCEFVLIVTADCERDVEWLATLTGRLGIAAGRSLFYVHGGVAWADVETDIDINILGFGPVARASGDESHTGWVAGLGFQHALTNNLTIGIEYSHIDLGDEDHDLSINGTPIGLSSNVDVVIDSINLSVNWKF